MMFHRHSGSGPFRDHDRGAGPGRNGGGADMRFGVNFVNFVRVNWGGGPS